jgi:transposase
MDSREQRGLEIAARFHISQKDGKWVVPSQSGKGKYIVNLTEQNCTCPDHETSGVKCKHIFAVEFTVEREGGIAHVTDGDLMTTTVTESLKVMQRVSYPQDWKSYNIAQTNEKYLFQELLRDLCLGLPEQSHEKGRKPLPLSDIVFSTAFKVYSCMSSRRFGSDLREAEAKGYITKACHFNSIYNYLEMEAFTPVLSSLITTSSLPLRAIETDFAVDSSGFSTCNYVRWFDVKYGKEMSQHEWIKCHLMTGVKTNIVTSVEVTDGYAGDSPRFKPLVRQTAKNFTIKEVSADKAYSSMGNHEIVAKFGGIPYIAFKVDAHGTGAGVFKKMYHYYCFNRDEFMKCYHKRSNVESTFSMIKAKFGGSLKSKIRTAQINEVLCKVLCHNICCVIQSMFEFGIEPSFLELPAV